MLIRANVLGTLDIVVNDVSIVPTASKPRRLLAMLVLNPGQVATVSSLVDEVWDQNPPRSATATLQTYVLQLRKRLERALTTDGPRSPKDILVTTHNGYLLDVEPDSIDAIRYEALASIGRRAMDDGDFGKAALALHSALGLWRGPALADVRTGPMLRVEATRLEENRLNDLDLRIEADLRLGRHRQLLGELATLCAQYPCQENFSALYMIALYRSGQQSRALDVYQTLRSVMSDQLGVDPSRRIRNLHQAILTDEPAVDDPDFVFTIPVRAPVAS